MNLRMLPAIGLILTATLGCGCTQSSEVTDVSTSSADVAPAGLAQDQWLLPGQGIWSNAGNGYNFVYQNDGNLVVYDPARRVVWASNTQGAASASLRMQRDCNLVLYRTDNVPVWASNTNYGNYQCQLTLQSNGALAIYLNYQGSWYNVWSTPTP